MSLFRAATARGNRPPPPRCARAARRTSLLPVRPSFTERRACGCAAFLLACLVAAQTWSPCRPRARCTRCTSVVSGRGALSAVVGRANRD